jgi:hypothetical protein
MVERFIGDYPFTTTEMKTDINIVYLTEGKK